MKYKIKLFIKQALNLVFTHLFVRFYTYKFFKSVSTKAGIMIYGPICLLFPPIPSYDRNTSCRLYRKVFPFCLKIQHIINILLAMAVTCFTERTARI